MYASVRMCLPLGRQFGTYPSATLLPPLLSQGFLVTFSPLPLSQHLCWLILHAKARSVLVPTEVCLAPVFRALSRLLTLILYLAIVLETLNVNLPQPEITSGGDPE